MKTDSYGVIRQEDHLLHDWRCNRKKSDKRTNEETREMIDYGVDHLFSDTLDE